MKFVIVGRGILGSSLYHMLRRQGHDVTVIESGERRIFPSLIHSLLLKGKDVDLAKESLKFYRELNVPMRELPSITLGDIRDEIIRQWLSEGVEIKESYIPWLGAEGLVAKGGDRLVYVSRLISSVDYVRGKAKVDLERGKVYVDDKEVKADKYIITAGPWNPCMLKVKSKSYYCWATLAFTRIRELGRYFVYDYEKGFYSRPLMGLGTGVVIVGDGKAVESPPGTRMTVNREEVLEKVRERLGELKPIYTAGEFCEGTPDMRPSYGEVIEGIYYAGGLDGYGAEVGPGVAKLLIKYIVSGEIERDYFLDRFSQVEEFSIGREPHEI